MSPNRSGRARADNPGRRPRSPWQSRRQAASKATRAFEEVRRGAVPELAAVREPVEATGPGPLVCVDRQAGAHADPADLNVTMETRASAFREHQDRGSAGTMYQAGLFISCLPTG
jgi:hypothetical protein